MQDNAPPAVLRIRTAGVDDCTLIHSFIMELAVYEKLAHEVIATPELLASFFGVDRVLVGDGVQATDAGVLSDIWGKHAILAYVETDTLANLGAPTFGYTYNLSGYPLVEEPYYDRQHKTWYFPVTRSEAPVIAASSAGYFIQNAVA